MAQNIGTIEAEIRANTSKLKTDLAKAKNEFSGTTASIKSMLSSVGTKLLGVVAGIKAMQFAFESVELTAKFEKQSDKLKAVFGEMTNVANNSIQEITDKYKVSFTELTKNYASTADLLTGIGFDKKSAIETTNEVQKLSIALARFNDVQGGVEGASIRLTKALLGERDGLVELGVKISEEDVKTELLTGKYDELLKKSKLLAKAQATLTLAKQQSFNALNALDNGTNNYLTSLEQLKARLKDIKTGFGYALLPVFQQVLNFFNKLAGVKKLDFTNIRATMTKIGYGIVNFFLKIKLFFQETRKSFNEFVLNLKTSLLTLANAIKSAFKIKIDTSELEKSIEKTKKKLQELQSDIVDTQQDIFKNKLKAELIDFEEENKTMEVNTKWTGARTNVAEFYLKMKESIEKLGNFFKESFKKGIDDTKEYFASIKEQFQFGKEFGYSYSQFEVGGETKTQGEGGSLLEGIVAGSFQAIKPAIDGVGKVFEILTGLGNDFLASAGGIFGLFLQLVTMSEPFQSFMETINPIIQDIANILGAVLMPVFDILAGALRALADVFVFIYEKVLRPVANGIIKIFNAVFKAIDSIPFVKFGFRLQELPSVSEMRYEKEARNSLTDTINNQTNIINNQTSAFNNQTSAFENLSDAVNLDILRAKLFGGYYDNNVKVTIELKGNTDAVKTVSYDTNYASHGG